MAARKKKSRSSRAFALLSGTDQAAIKGTVKMKNLAGRKATVGEETKKRVGASGAFTTEAASKGKRGFRDAKGKLRNVNKPAGKNALKRKRGKK